MATAGLELAVVDGLFGVRVWLIKSSFLAAKDDEDDEDEDVLEQLVGNCIGSFSYGR